MLKLCQRILDGGWGLFKYMQLCLPTVYANHHQAGKVEADAAGDDGVGGREVKGAGRILLAIVLHYEWLVRPMQAQGDGHKGHKGRQQPNGSYRYNCYPTCHPTSVSEKCLHWIY